MDVWKYTTTELGEQSVTTASVTLAPKYFAINLAMGTAVGLSTTGTEVVGQIWLDNVQCTGSETDFTQCRHRGWGRHDCSHSDDVSIACAIDMSNSGTVRLVGSSVPYVGRLEVFHNGQWGTVCINHFSHIDAQVFCYQLGFGRSGRSLGYGSYRGGSGPIWLDYVACNGYETDFTQCGHRGWGSHTCSHYYDVSIRCSPNVNIGMYKNSAMRLVEGINPSEGRVEIFINNTWGTVCDNNFTNASAQVLCYMLGFGHVGRFLHHKYGHGSGRIWLDNVRCNGAETSINSCSHRGLGVNSCSHSQDVSISCDSPLPMRLVDGMNTNAAEGRLEVYHNGTWGTVCDDDFTDVEAKVACNGLGFGYVGHVLRGIQEPGTGTIWLDQVSCVDSCNTEMKYCNHSVWGVHDCGHKEDVSIACYDLSTTAETTADLRTTHAVTTPPEPSTTTHRTTKQTTTTSMTSTTTPRTTTTVTTTTTTPPTPNTTTQRTTKQTTTTFMFPLTTTPRTTTTVTTTTTTPPAPNTTTERTTKQTTTTVMSPLTTTPRTTTTTVGTTTNTSPKPSTTQRTTTQTTSTPKTTTTPSTTTTTTNATTTTTPPKPSTTTPRTTKQTTTTFKSSTTPRTTTTTTTVTTTTTTPPKSSTVKQKTTKHSTTTSRAPTTITSSTTTPHVSSRTSKQTTTFTTTSDLGLHAPHSRHNSGGISDPSSIILVSVIVVGVLLLFVIIGVVICIVVRPIVVYSIRRKRERANSQAVTVIPMSRLPPASSTNAHDDTALEGYSKKTYPTSDLRSTNENFYSDFQDVLIPADGAVGGHM